MTFSRDIARFVKKSRLRADLVLRKIALDGLTGVLFRSPVGNPDLWKSGRAPAGYVGGRYRANWRVGVNAVNIEAVDDPLPQGVNARDEVAIQSAVFGDTIHITQNLPYAVPIEEGHSSQAPEGVLHPTFEELKESIRRLVSQTKTELP